MRRCPVCRHVELSRVRTRAAEVDACPGCRGLWLDGRELGAALEEPEVRAIEELAEEAVPRCRRCDAASATAPCSACGGHVLPCPACDGALLVSVQKGDVRLDACRSCAGIWLDAGELLALSHLSEGALSIEAAAFGAAPDRSDADKMLTCATCARPVSRTAAFPFGLGVYCGSCAPREGLGRGPDQPPLRPEASGDPGDEGPAGLLELLAKLFR